MLACAGAAARGALAAAPAALARPRALPRAALPQVQQQQQQQGLLRTTTAVAATAAPQQIVPAWTAVVSRLFGTFHPNKTHSGAKKRFRVKKDGTLDYLGSHRRHKMHKKNRKHTREKGLVLTMDGSHPRYRQTRRALLS